MKIKWIMDWIISKRRLLKISYRLIGVTILAYLLTRLNFAAVYANLKHINLWYLSLAVILVVPMVAGKALRWKMMLKDYGIHLSLKECIIVYFKGYSLGTVTPGQVGELIKIVEVKALKPDAGKAVVFATIVNDRFYDLAGLVLFCFPFLFYYSHCSIVLTALAFVVVLYILLKPNSLFFLLHRWIDFRFSERYWFNFIITVMITLIIILRGVLIFLAVGVIIPLHIVAIFLPFINVVSLLPISISGFGTREAVMVYLFSNWSVTFEEIVLTGILMGFVFFILNGLLGSLIIIFKTNDAKIGGNS